ncbi:MAG: HAMP domain-containing histidine kinase [Candidatus Eremiobacteraeota bacterium]|nr:HAMP domain-containing histidine kinase [Candidatus Eremiobacteraeota bacterium]
MIRSRTLQGRLTAAYAVALLGALILFAAFTLVLIDRVQRAGVDAQLTSEASAAAALVAPEPGTATPELENPAQFRNVVGVESNGALIAPDGRVLLATVVDVPRKLRAFANETVGGTRTAYVPLGRSTARAAAAVLGAGSRRAGTVVLWRSIDDIGDVDRRIAIGFALAIPLLTLGAVLASRAVARRALAPLRELAALASGIEASDLTRRLHRAGDDELGALCAAFDRMLDRLERAFERQRRFAGDLAHELRAPLAVMLAEIDLARRRARSRSEYERALDVIRGETVGLDTMTSDLLGAYRDDDLPRNEQLDLASVAGDAAARVAPLARAHAIEIMSETAPGVTIAGDRNELRRALVAVLENAFKYGGNERTVHLVVADENDEATVTIRDEGPGFSAAALAHARERFWRDDVARRRDGTGLGLSLADALVRRSGGTLSLANDPRGGGLVRFAFPCAAAADSSQRHNRAL